MRIIPAIDIIDGKCVRLSQGDYQRKVVYNEDPLEVAKAYEEAGIKYLHVVDLDGAKSNRIVNYKVLNRIASSTKLSIDFGGGIKSNEDLKIAFENGANQITGGSIAIKKPELFSEWLSIYGSDKIILGADSLNRKVASNGWKQYAKTDVLDFIQSYMKQGVQYVICTDISKDGMMQGPSFELYKEILKATKPKLIASGGVSEFDDLIQLKDMGCEGAIIGKALYENQITLKQLSALC